MGLLPMDKLEVAGVGAVEEVVRMPDPGSSQEDCINLPRPSLTVGPKKK